MDKVYVCICMYNKKYTFFHCTMLLWFHCVEERLAFVQHRLPCALSHSNTIYTFTHTSLESSDKKGKSFFLKWRVRFLH